MTKRVTIGLAIMLVTGIAFAGTWLQAWPWRPKHTPNRIGPSAPSMRDGQAKSAEPQFKEFLKRLKVLDKQEAALRDLAAIACPGKKVEHPDAVLKQEEVKLFLRGVAVNPARPIDSYHFANRNRVSKDRIGRLEELAGRANKVRHGKVPAARQQLALIGKSLAKFQEETAGLGLPTSINDKEYPFLALARVLAEEACRLGEEAILGSENPSDAILPVFSQQDVIVVDMLTEIAMRGQAAWERLGLDEYQPSLPEILQRLKDQNGFIKDSLDKERDTFKRTNPKKERQCVILLKDAMETFLDSLAGVDCRHLSELKSP